MLLKPLNSLFLLTALVVMAGCSGRNVLFGDQVAEYVATADPSVVQVYFDRDGSLYPGLLGKTQTPNNALGSPACSLMQQFEQSRCANAEMQRRWKQIFGEQGLDRHAPEAWESLQIKIRSHIAHQIRTATAEFRRPLVILIHGFNVENSAEQYQQLRERIAEHAKAGRAPSDLAYLYVSWDGLRGSSVPKQTWLKAQFNFPLVGQGLRKLLISLNEAQPASHLPPGDAEPDQRPPLTVRVITHSSGGPVISHALWDGRGATPIGATERAYPPYREYLDELQRGVLEKPSLDDLRVGMLVPAMPESIFKHYAGSHDKGLSHIILGVNPTDQDVTKHLGENGCAVLGDSCLPVNRALTCRALRQFDSLETTFSIVHFQEQHKHDVSEYLANQAMDDFLDLLFAENGTTQYGRDYCEDDGMSDGWPKCGEFRRDCPGQAQCRTPDSLAATS